MYIDIDLSQLNIVASVLPAGNIAPTRTPIFRLVSALRPASARFCSLTSGTEEYLFLVHKTVTDGCNYSGCTLYVDHLSLL